MGPNRQRTPRGWLLHAVLVAWMVASAGIQPAGAIQATDTQTTCATTDNGYTVEVCLTAPDTSVPLSDDTPISATVSVSDKQIGIRRVVFELNGRRVLTDFDAPYAFLLPVAYFGTGSWNLTAYARLSDDSDSDPAIAKITIATGEPMTFSPGPFTPATGLPAEEGRPFVVAAIGDSAGGSPESAAISDLIGSWNPNLLLYLGDVYNSGTYTEYMNWYDPGEFMGRFRDITLPTPGNHEYGGEDRPRGYMEYWGEPPHAYSIDAAGWHIVSVDSNPRFDEISAGSEQMQWLENDLATSKASCTVVFFHHPPFTVGSYTEEGADLGYLWELLVQNDVTLVLSGHDHNYQRWLPLDAQGAADPEGTIPIVVGTGGQSVYASLGDDDRLASPALTDTGALRLELNQHGAGLQFITTDGDVRDSDVVECDPSRAADTEAPSAPPDVSATRQPDGSVVVRWSPALDDTGVSHYEVYRGAKQIASGAVGDSFIDRDAPETDAPAWRVVAVDEAGNVSPTSDGALAADTPEPPALFSGNFDSGMLHGWDKVEGLALSPMDDPEGGSVWAVRARGSNDPAYALTTVPGIPGGDTVYGFAVTIRFQVIQQAENPIVFLRLRNEAGDSLMSVNVVADHTFGIYNDVARSGIASAVKIPPGDWHEVTVEISPGDGSMYLRITLDGEEVGDLTGPIDLSGEQPAIVQLGDSTSGRFYDVAYSAFTIWPSHTTMAPPAAATPVAFALPRPGKIATW